MVTRGDASYGGDSRSVATQLRDVRLIYSNTHAFAALTKGGSVITWGNPTFGGDSSAAGDDLQEGVIQVAATSQAFTALKEDAAVIWGGFGGTIDGDAADELVAGAVRGFGDHAGEHLPQPVIDALPINLSLSLTQGQGNERVVNVSFDARMARATGLNPPPTYATGRPRSQALPATAMSGAPSTNRTMWLLRVSEE